MRFHILYTIATPTSRDYGVVTLQSGQQLLDLSVSQGWVKMRDDAGKKQDSASGQELLERLQALEATAKAEDRGLWATNATYIETKNELADPKTFVEQHKDTQLDGMIL